MQKVAKNTTQLAKNKTRYLTIIAIIISILALIATLLAGVYYYSQTLESDTGTNPTTDKVTAEAQTFKREILTINDIYGEMSFSADIPETASLSAVMTPTWAEDRESLIVSWIGLGDEIETSLKFAVKGGPGGGPYQIEAPVTKVKIEGTKERPFTFLKGDTSIFYRVKIDSSTYQYMTKESYSENDPNMDPYDYSWQCYNEPKKYECYYPTHLENTLTEEGLLYVMTCTGTNMTTCDSIVKSIEIIKGYPLTE